MLSVIHQNAQFATNKVEELSLLCEELKPDVFIVSEQSFKTNTIGFFKIQNYELASAFLRKSYKGGGVAIFVKNHLKFEPFRINYSSDLDFEVEGVNLSLNSFGQLSVIGLYRSPRGCSDAFFEKFESLLLSFQSKSTKFIIAGDFNINILDHNDPLTQRLRDVLNSFGLEWSVNSPTRVTARSSTAIDNVITNIHNASVSVLDTAISDHFAQEVVIGEIIPVPEPPILRLKRVTHPRNIQLLNGFLFNESWSFLDGSESVEKAYNAFNDRLMCHIDAACPFRMTREKHRKQRNSWLTPGILKSRERIKFYYSIFRETNNEEFKAFFLNYRRIYRKVIKAAKAYDIENTLKTAGNFSKTAWKIINTTIKPEPSNFSKPIKIKDCDKLIESPQEVATAFNNFFSTVARPNSNFRDQVPPSVSSDGPVSSMVLHPVAEGDVECVIQKLNSKQSCDVNGISVWLLKRCFRHILKPLTKLINLSFELGTFPSHLKTAKITPIFKKDDPCLASNYRPISILPVLSKIFEKLFLERLINFLNRFEILNPIQFGFQKDKSTIDAIIHLVEAVMEGLERQEHVLTVFLDLSKAFDCVHHATLLHKLEVCGVRGVPLKWLSSYLCDRGQYVQIENALSQRVSINQGVPQGSILGPVLFLIYVNDLGTLIQNGKIVQYADDTTLCVKEKSKIDLEISTFIQLSSCIQYFSEINLQANSTKTNYINFCYRQQDSEFQPIVIVDETLLEEVESNKFLGMYLDKGLTWEDHVEHVSSKVSSGIYALRNLAKICSFEVLRMAYFGLIYSHMSYGLSLWGSCAKSKFERVFRLQKKAVRIMAKLKPRESCRDAFRELRLLTLPSLYILQVTLCCRFRCEMTQGRDIHDYGTRGRNIYRVQQHRTRAFERLPSQAGVRLFNKLPESVKESAIPSQFKSRLKHLLILKAFYSVDEFMSCRWDH